MANEHAELVIGGVEVEVSAAVGHEALSELFTLDVRGRALSAIDPSEVAGGPASLTLRDGFGGERTIHGVVADLTALAVEEGTTHLHLVLRPAAFTATLGRSSRVFHGQSVVGIVDRVLAGVPHRWELSGSYPTYEYVAQYREDDWTFVQRWLEKEGIAFWFDHESGSELVLTDDTTAAPDIAGNAYLPFHPETGMIADHEVVVELGSYAVAAPTKFSVGSFDPARPNLKVSGEAGAGALEIYDAPGGGPTSPDGCAKVAANLADAAKAASGGVTGAAALARLCHGRVVEIGDHPLARLNGRFVIRRLRFEVRQRRRDNPEASGTPFEVRFEAIPLAVPFRPEPKTPLAEQAGLQSGVVVGAPGEEIFPDPTGRVRVQLHWDREGARNDKSGWWMRVAQRGTHDSMLLPRVGWNVLTFNEEGAVDAPSVLSRIFDAEHPPTYALPENKTRVVFKTATSPADGTYNEIRYEDKAGDEEMFINASRDMNILTQHVEIETVMRDAGRAVDHDRFMEVGHDLNEKVERNQSISIGSNETSQVGAGQDVAVMGSETFVVAGNRKIKTGEGHTISVSSNRSLSVGAVMLDNSFKNIGGGSDVVVHMTGGAVLKATTGGIDENTGGVSLQVIGGAKLDFAKGERAIDVSKQYVEVVGGLWFSKTDETYVDDAREKATWMVGAAMTSKAPEVNIEAGEKIEIVCGKSALVITAESVQIRGTELSLADADSLEIITKKVEHN
jgi:type VI secretion system secreted protein VgrG